MLGLFKAFPSVSSFDVSLSALALCQQVWPDLGVMWEREDASSVWQGVGLEQA